MKSTNYALADMQRRQRLARRENKRSHLSAIDKLRLLLRLRNLLKNATMKNWKTTLGGLLIAAAQAVPSILPPEWHWLKDAFTGIGGLIVGSYAIEGK